ncbi:MULTISPECIES: Sua5/YciO/YrdC/YwlC family protein [Sulfurimonas]|uniref:Sua5/YciO/YrdC/YwlC family protein n=1 Tax=Sulfurimonas TaxID=202746 RepID=UPI00126582C1|nr:Sua5/YciO/YrdC/YwlC family protein [Sulfurimonas indica]
MVQSNSTSRLSRIKKSIILAQTDTTVGFLSQDAAKLREIKSRQSNKPFIKVFQNFKTLQKTNIRIPKSRKKMLRRAKKTTFIVKNQAFRIAPYSLDSEVLRKLEWSYSTSANESGRNYERSFCEQKADIIVEDKQGLFEGRASRLYKINNTKIKRLR